MIKIDCEEIIKKVAINTPVHCGVGTMALDMLLRNTLLAQKIRSRKN